VRDTVSNIQPAAENINILVGMTKKLSSDWELAFKGSLFQRNSVNNRGLQPVFSTQTFAGNTSLNDGVLVSNIGRVASTLIPANSSFNQLGAPARLYGYIPGTDPSSTIDNTSKTQRYALDLHGSAYGWDVSVAGGLTKVDTSLDYSGYVDRSALYSALVAYGNNSQAPNGFNPLGGNSPAVLSTISPRFSNHLESTLNYFDAVGSRELMTLGAGPLALAAGIHWHKHEQNSPAASLTANGQVANTTAFVMGSETNTAAFGELQATPIKNLELHLSGRYDHYDTFGHSFTPAASFKFAPVQQVAFRGTFARGFRAPNPAEVGNAGSFFTFNAIDDPVLCKDGSQTTKGNVPSACSINPPFVQTTNKNLSPEKSKSYTLGVVVEPMRGLNATLDYYKIEVNNQIVTAAGNDPNFAPDFARNPIVPIEIANGDGTTTVGTPAAGSVIYAKSPYINLGSTKTSGLEADINYRWRLPSDLGTLRADLSAAHTIDYKQSIGGVTYSLAGTQGPSVVGGATGNPKDRAQFSLDWNRGPLDVTLNLNYTSAFSTLDPSVGGTSCSNSGKAVGGRNYFQNLPQPDIYCEVASFTAANLNVQYKLTDNLTLRGAILNMFDRQPPIDVATYGNATSQTAYNASLHQAGAIGRFFNLGLSYTF
jgi:iron complex outermembrane receptor protein